jgi:hypothetical protein
MVLKNALVIGPIIKELAEEASTSDANLEVGDRIGMSFPPRLSITLAVGD